MVKLPSLYFHQEDMRDEARVSLARYQRSVVCAPPGTGKTRLAKWILGSYCNRERQDGQSGTSMFCVHRRGLVDNASESFSEEPRLAHGVIMAGRDTSGSLPVQVASIDTLISWYCEGGKYATEYTFDMIAFDECHSHVSKLRTFLDAHDVKRAEMGLRPAYVLGLSATPQHKELSKVFNHIVYGPEPRWLIDHGYLSPFRYFRCTQGQLGLLVRRGDEYTEESVSNAMSGLAGNLVEDWKKHAMGRATVGFFPRRQHAQEAMELFCEHGVEARYVDGNTPDDERRKLFKALDCGEITYLCNVGVIERGTDIPFVSCVQLATAIGSVVRYRQMIGRGSRVLGDSHPMIAVGKRDCIVLDHAKNIRDHGFFEDSVAWTLEWGERPSKTHDARATIECPSCGAVYRGGKCRACGYEPTARERKKQGMEFVGGELREIKPDDKQSTKKRTCEQMMISALYQAGRLNLTWTQAWVIAKRESEKQGTKLRVPARFEVAGVTYRAIPYGSVDAKRKVRHTYGFTVNDHTAASNPYRVGEF